MANSVPSDHFQSTGQTPIVLARLPRVGAAPPMPAVPQAVPLPEVMPQLDLRSEIDQRIRLHIADTPTDQAPTPSHFADRGHVVEHGPTVRPVEQTATSLPMAAPQHSSAEPQATTFSEKLFQLHAQLAPHAGLIVALALIASAGLLYWMIVGPAQAPMVPSYENYGESYGFDLQGEDSGTTSHYSPEFSVDVPQPAETANEAVSSPDQRAPNQWNKVQLPAPPQTETPSPLAFPEAEPVTLQELPPADESHFPTTSHPHALEFSKLKQPAAHFPQSLPEVARRPITSTNR